MKRGQSRRRLRVIEGGGAVNVPIGKPDPKLDGPMRFRNALFAFIQSYVQFQQSFPPAYQVTEADVALIALRVGVGSSLALGVPDEQLYDAIANIIEQEVAAAPGGDPPHG